MTSSLVLNTSARLHQLEDILLFLFHIVHEGTIEPIDDGCGQAEAGDNLIYQIPAERSLSRQSRQHAPLLLLNEIDSRMIGAEAFRRPGQGRSVEINVHQLAQFPVIKKTPKLSVLLKKLKTDGQQLLAFWHIDARRNYNFCWRNVKVVAAAGGLFQPCARPPRGDMRFVWRFVGGEARVAVNPHHGLL